MVDKVIITNKTALKGLYKKKYTKVIDAVNLLIKADEKKGIKSSLIFIDDKEQMVKFNVAPVTNVNNEKQNKEAVDSIFKDLEPEFILLLGGPDIIPHQHLESPMADQLKKLYHTKYFQLDDFPCDILKIPSDMPYACDTPYKKTVSEYLNEYVKEGLESKERYVGRLAGITGNKDPEALIIAIETAINVKPQDKKEYSDYFSINTVSPKTDYAQKILNDLFKNDKDLQESPPADSDNWTKKQLSATTHLFVCHGTPNVPYWYGETEENSENKFVIALEPENIQANISPNTVVASLCCYGAQLYDPNEALSDKYVTFLNNIGMHVDEKKQLSLCNTYLQNKVAAFLGSTYFSSDSTILEYFLENIRQGKTTGEAIFDARHQYVQDNPEHMELDFLQATLAEFILLGDPSAQLIIHEEDVHDTDKKLELRKSRKAEILSKTKKLLKDTSQMKHNVKLQPGKKARSHIDQLAKEHNLEQVEVKSYQTDREKKITHVVSGVKKSHKDKLIPRITIHVVTEEGDKVETKKTIHSH